MVLMRAMSLVMAVAATGAAPAASPHSRPAAFSSHQALREHFAERRKAANRRLAEERLQALEAFLASATGDDLEAACRDFIATASELGRHGEVVDAADRYLKAFGSSGRAAGIAGTRVNAFIELGRLDQARDEWTRLADAFKPGGDLGAVYEPGMRLADVLVLNGCIDDARKQYDEMNRRFGRYPNVGILVARRISALSWIGREPPALEGNDLDGEPVRLEDYRGRVVLLDFWSTACGPCVRELPDMIRVYEENRRRGFDVVGICLDPDTSVLKAFLAVNPIPWRQICDGQSWRGPNATAYGVRAVPTLLLLGRDGKVVFTPMSADEIEYALRRLLTPPPTTAPSVTGSS